MNLNQLRWFCALARNQHYSRTAEELSIAQPSLSRSISQLEEELGCRLFEKKGRNVILTRPGKVFYTYVERGLRNIDQGIATAKEMMDPFCGTVDFAFIYALSPNFVPGLIRNFLNEKNHKDINFRFYQGNSKDIIQGVKDGKYDIGFSSYFADEPLVEFIPIVKQEYVLMVAKNHPLARKENITLEETAAYDFILPLDKTNYVENLFREKGLVPRSSSRVEEDHAAAALVSINLGISIIPKNDILSYYGVELIPFSPKPLYRQFYMVTAKKHIFTPAANTFYKFILEATGAKNNL